MNDDINPQHPHAIYMQQITAEIAQATPERLDALFAQFLVRNRIGIPRRPPVVPSSPSVTSPSTVALSPTRGALSPDAPISMKSPENKR